MQDESLLPKDSAICFNASSDIGTSIDYSNKDEEIVTKTLILNNVSL